MVAEHPDQVAAGGEVAQAGLVAWLHAAGAAVVVKRVTEGDQGLRSPAAEHAGQTVERGRGVPRGQQAAAGGGGGGFFEVQVGDGEQALGGPDDRAVGVEHQPLAGEVDGGGGHAPCC